MKTKWLPATLLCMLQAADAASTRLALHLPGTIELNPLVRLLGLWPAKLLILALLLLWAWRTRRPGRLWAVAAVYTCIVLSNVVLALHLLLR